LIDKSHFEGWITKKFGKKLYRVFFKGYSEKLWGLKCEELDSSFAIQRIKKFSFISAFIELFSFMKMNKHATTLDEFAYPHEGTGALYKRMAESILKHKGEILFNTAVKKILFEGQKVIGVECSDGTKISADFVISSMPIHYLLKSFDMINPMLLKLSRKLKFRNTILVYLEVDDTDLFEDNWLYIQSEDVMCGRITNFRNWHTSLNQKSDKSILCLEYWCHSEDSIWEETDNVLYARANTDIEKTKLFSTKKILRYHVEKIPNSYPVYYKGYDEDIQLIKRALTSFENLLLIGRYGSYKYNNQDHSLLMGIMAAEKIISDPTIDLWNIHSDEVYDESYIQDLRQS